MELDYNAQAMAQQSIGGVGMVASMKQIVGYGRWLDFSEDKVTVKADLMHGKVSSTRGSMSKCRQRRDCRCARGCTRQVC
jgi:hypothetical protein